MTPVVCESDPAGVKIEPASGGHDMTRHTFRAASTMRLAATLAGAVLLALLQLSCATTGPAQGTPMPAARASLRPEYRVFYDELQDYGDWVLIEPYGFVFRPRTRFGTWSPYFDGFWSPSDSYGWIWVSGEPFGWATYHYGAWINDSYEGWVWVPGLDWAPAWVAWAGNQSYVGWAALTPSGNPAGRFIVVPVAEMGTTDLRSHVLSQDRAVSVLRDSKPIENFAEVDHTIVNRGPSIDWVEQVAGPLTRARLEDVNPRPDLGRSTTSGPAVADERPAVTPERRGIPSPTEFRKAAESEAAKTRTIMQQKQPAPEVIPRILLTDAPARPASPAAAPRPQPAKPDTVR